MTATTTLSLGGLLTALLVLYANLHPWYTGGRQMAQLASFGKGFAAAACAAACPGGMLGWTSGRSGTVANGTGERLGQSTTGTAQTSGLTSGQLVGLGATGAAVVVLVVFAVGLSWKAAAKAEKRRIVGGAYVGSVFCLTAGVAGMLSWLPGALNSAGTGIADAFQGAGVL